jgi:hypothetical protein
MYVSDDFKKVSLEELEKALSATLSEKLDCVIEFRFQAIDFNRSVMAVKVEASISKQLILDFSKAGSPDGS